MMKNFNFANFAEGSRSAGRSVVPRPSIASNIIPTQVLLTYDALGAGIGGPHHRLLSRRPKDSPTSVARVQGMGWSQSHAPLRVLEDLSLQNSTIGPFLPHTTLRIRQDTSLHMADGRHRPIYHSEFLRKLRTAHSRHSFLRTTQPRRTDHTTVFRKISLHVDNGPRITWYLSDPRNLPDPLIVVLERRQFDNLGQLLVATRAESRSVGKRQRRNHPTHFSSAPQGELQVPRSLRS